MCRTHSVLFHPKAHTHTLQPPRSLHQPLFLSSLVFLCLSLISLILLSSIMKEESLQWVGMEDVFIHRLCVIIDHGFMGKTSQKFRHDEYKTHTLHCCVFHRVIWETLRKKICSYYMETPFNKSSDIFQIDCCVYIRTDNKFDDELDQHNRFYYFSV